MLLKSHFAAAAFSLTLFILPLGLARAADCPAASTMSDDVVAALNAAKGCDAAMKVFEACQLGAGGDTEYGEVVEKKCEADFLDKASASRKQSYKRELGVCDRKYRNKSGTMYISFTAFCRAQAAQRYSQQMRKAAR